MGRLSTTKCTYLPTYLHFLGPYCRFGWWVLVLPTRSRVVVLPVGPPVHIRVQDCHRTGHPARMVCLDDMLVVG